MDIFELAESIGITQPDTKNMETVANIFDDTPSDNIATGYAPDISGTVYIVCKKKSFRAEGLFNLFSEEYNTQIIYTSDKKMPELVNPLCFVIDITDFIGSKSAQKAVLYINEVAANRNKPIYLIGEPEDLDNTAIMFKRSDISVTKFKRPIDTKRVIYEITTDLLTSKPTEKKKHVVIVDDSITYLKLMQKKLQEHYRVTVASSALECIKLILGFKEPPDMIIIDYIMPICDGPTLVGMLRQEPQLNDTPIIFYSGNTETDDIINLMPMIDGYILKTEPVTDLAFHLEEIYKKKKTELKEKRNKKKKGK